MSAALPDLRFEILGRRLPGRNEMELAARTNRYRAANQKARFQDIVSVHLRASPSWRHRDPAARYNLRFTWFERTRRRDPDNISGGCKIVLDAMQPDIIDTDGWRHVGNIEHRFVVSGQEGVIVEMWKTYWE